MTIDISNNNPRISYSVASGVTQTSFAVPFEFFDNTDINVYVDGTLKTITTDYTVSGGDGSTGTITISVTGASGGSIVVITRDITIERTTDFTAGIDINRAALNTQLDTLTAIAADLQDKVDRSLSLTDYDYAAGLTLPERDVRKGKTLAFDTTTGDVGIGPSISDTQALADASADIALLADIQDGTLATNAITTAASISSNITTVANISSNVTTVAGISANVTTVAGISADVTAVAADATDIGVVSANIADINTAAANIFDIQDASAYAANAATSASNAATSETNAATSASNAATSETNAATSASAAAASQTAAAASAASAASAYDSFDDRYLGPKTSDPTLDNDGNALVSGALYFNSTANEMRVYDGANWIAASSAGGASLLNYNYTATSGQTTFSGADDNAATLSYTQQNLIVTLNGIVLEDGTDYTASNGTSIVLASGASAGDELNIVAFKSFTTADMVPASTGGTFSGNVAVTGNLTVDTNTLYVDSTNNRIGIGTTSPAEALHVVGGGRFTGDASFEALELITSDNNRVFITGNSSVSGDMWRIGTSTSNPNLNIDALQASGEIVLRTGGTNERMRIDSSGNVGIGTSNPLHELDISGVVRSSGSFNPNNSDWNNAAFRGQGSYGGGLALVDGSSGYGIWAQDAGGTLAIGQGSTGGALTERMRIDSAGRLLVSRTGNDGTARLQVDATSSYYGIGVASGSASTVYVLEFRNANGVVGTITTSGSSTSYNTSSDYRLKENVTPLSGAADRLAQIPVHQFNFIANPDTTVDGFLAHEVQAVVPEAVTGSKDAMRDEEYEVTPAVVDEDGNEVTPAVMGTRSVPDYQGIDQSKLVPLLTAALKEALTEIADLKARVTALEAN
jgi:hypothetical protein